MPCLALIDNDKAPPFSLSVYVLFFGHFLSPSTIVEIFIKNDYVVLAGQVYKHMDDHHLKP